MRGPGRAWRRLRAALAPRPEEVFYSPAYRVDLSGVPYDPLRADRILTFLLAEGLLARRRVRPARTASMRDLRRVHEDPYLESLHHPPALVPVFGFEPRPEALEKTLRAHRRAVGGTLEASRSALAGGRAAINLSGGFHHARADAGRGFCMLNDVAVGIHGLRAGGFAGRVLIVDLDLHDGDGTRAIFARDPEVFTFSIHNQTWDSEPAVASLSVELGGGVHDDAYLAALREHLPRLLDEHRPDLVYYLAGTDPAADDRIGNWAVTAAGMLARDRFVVERVRAARADLPLVVTLCGGYGNQAWRYSARFFAWLLCGRALEPPSTRDLTLARYRRLTAARPRQIPVPSATALDLALRDEDVYSDLRGAEPSHRLLGRYSAHSIELALERGGIMERLRNLGFAHPDIELIVGRPGGDTVRLHGDAERSELLMELRVGRDRHALAGFELLRLEWLLLQNPRARFDGRRQPLPGQQHPGLGLLGEVMALLVLLCEEVGLDGILFVPSHYHLAATGRKFLRFLDADDAAWYEALSEAVAGLPPAEATRAIADGSVVDAASGEPAAWRPMPMVLATSERLRDRLEQEGPEESPGHPRLRLSRP